VKMPMSWLLARPTPTLTILPLLRNTVCRDTKGPPRSMVNVSSVDVMRNEPIAKDVSCIDTLDAYIDKYTSLVPFIADTVTGTPASDAAPPELTSAAISLQVP
jgi:hypothetical protein